MRASDSGGRKTAKDQKNPPNNTTRSGVFVAVGLKSLVRSIRCDSVAISESISFARVGTLLQESGPAWQGLS